MIKKDKCELTSRQRRGKAPAFSMRMFSLGLARLRVPALLLAAVSVAASVISPIATVHDVPLRTMVITARVQCPVLVLMPWVMLIFCFFLFSYQNTRRGADVFDALPYTKTCLYFSFFASALTYTEGIALLSLGSSAITYMLTLKTVYFMPDYIAVLFLLSLLATLMVGFMMLTAFGLSGTNVTAACNFALFLFMPKLLGESMLSLLRQDFYIYSTPSILDEVSAYFRLLPLGLFEFYTQKVSIYAKSPDIVRELTPLSSYQCCRWGYLLYSFLVTVFFFVLSLYLFRRRDSAMAEKTVIPGKTHVALRVLWTLPLAVFAASSVITGRLGITNILRLRWNGITLILLTVLLYFVLEWGTARKIRKVGKLVLEFGWVIVGTAFLLLSCFLINHAYHAMPIHPEEVSSVVVPAKVKFSEVEQASPYYYQGGYAVGADEIGTIRMLTDAYDICRTHQEKFWTENDHFFNVKFRMKNGQCIERCVSFTDNSKYDEYSEMYKKDVISDYPFFSEESDAVCYSCTSVITNSFQKTIDWSADTGAEFFRLWFEDYNRLTLDEKYTLLETYRATDDDYFHVICWVSSEEKGYNDRLTIAVSKRYTPQAYKFFCNNSSSKGNGGK